MKSSPTPSAANREPQSLPGDKKRKRSANRLHATEDRPSLSQQRSIQDLFPTQGKSPVVSSTYSELSPERKRPKPQPSVTQTPPSASHTHLTPEKMYTFASKQSPGGIVDLTNSPPRNGQPRRLNGVKPVTAMNPHQGAKKLVVKNLKKDSTWDPEQYMNQVWVRLDSALTDVFAGGKESFTMEDLYRGVENVCKQGKAKAVYDRLHRRCTHHLSSSVLPAIQSKSEDGDNVATLNAVLAAWASWTSQVVSQKHYLSKDMTLTRTDHDTMYLLLYGPVVSPPAFQNYPQRCLYSNVPRHRLQ